MCYSVAVPIESNHLWVIGCRSISGSGNFSHCTIAPQLTICARSSPRMPPSSHQSLRAGRAVEKYLQVLKGEPYQLVFTRIEVVYSLPRRAATRTDVLATAPGRFNLRERVTIDWQVEDGYWRISRIAFSDWSPIVGSWRRSGLNREGSIELRILPDGNYIVYVGGDYTAPQFRGRYRLEANKIVFTDTSSIDPQQLQGGEGSYLFVRTARELTCARSKTRTPGGPSATKASGHRLIRCGEQIFAIAPTLGNFSRARAGSSAVERQSYTLLVGGSIPSLPTILAKSRFRRPCYRARN